MADLILTNGDVAANLLTEADAAPVVLPWRDVLHEGPLQPAPSLERFSEARAAYLAARFRLDPVALQADFQERDKHLRNHGSYGKIEIWLEHDLYDQLQLLQILAFFAGQHRTDGLVLVQADDFLGHQRPDTIMKFANRARPVDQVMLDIAAQVWNELSQPTPDAVTRRVRATTGILTYLFPFLETALIRFLAELPSPRSGLSATETTLLSELSAGGRAAGTLFRGLIAREPAPFMGDFSFFRILEDLASCTRPLIDMADPRFVPAKLHHADQDVRLTDHGKAVLAGSSDHIGLNGIDRWWAGTHLTEPNCWRYDRQSGSLIAPGRSAKPEVG